MQAGLKILFGAPVRSECKISIAVPVRDEAEHLPQTLDALAKQFDLQHRPLDPAIYEILVLANNCRDHSAQTAREWREKNFLINLHIAEICLPPKFSNIGYVRRRLMNEAFRRLTLNGRGGGIIAATDGDTRVAPDWIVQTMEEIKCGADAVGGRILMADEELARMDEQARYFHLLDEEYRLLVAEYECHLDGLAHDARPRHHQHFNGSFAVTTEVFKQAGGIPDVPFLEDIAFYHALLRVDAKVRHSPLVKVFTSSRHSGRSPIGLSFQLNEWKKLREKNAQFFVESASTIHRRMTARKTLREFRLVAETSKYPKAKAVAAFARQTGVPRRFIFKQLQKTQTFGSLLENIYRRQIENQKWRRRNSPVPVETAIDDLKIMLGKLRSENLIRDELKMSAVL